MNDEYIGLRTLAIFCKVIAYITIALTIVEVITGLIDVNINQIIGSIFGGLAISVLFFSISSLISLNIKLHQGIKQIESNKSNDTKKEESTITFKEWGKSNPGKTLMDFLNSQKPHQ